MAKKKATRKKTGARRRRRTPEEIIQDLQRQIAEVRARAEARKLKESPAVKATLKAVRALDKALDLAAEEDNTALRHVLADARAPLRAFFDEQGLKLPKARLPRGPRPRAGA